MCCHDCAYLLRRVEAERIYQSRQAELESLPIVRLDENGDAVPLVDPFDLLKTVSSQFSVSQKRVKSPKKYGRRVCVARDELCRRLYREGWSKTEIGEFLSRKCSSVEKAIKRAEDRITESQLREQEEADSS